MKKLVIAGLLITTLLLILLSGCKPAGKAIQLPTYSPTNIADFPYMFTTSTDTTIGYDGVTVFAPSTYTAEVNDLLNFMRLKACQLLPQGLTCVDQQGNPIPTAGAVLGLRGITGAYIAGQGTDTALLSRCGRQYHGVYDNAFGLNGCPQDFNWQEYHGYIYTTQKPDTVPLYSCYRAIRTNRVTGTERTYHDYYISTDAACESFGTNAGLLGYVYTSQKPNTVPLYRCWMAIDDIEHGRWDHFTSSSSCGEWTQEAVYYILPFCTETDNGKDLFNKGTTTSQIDSATYTDTCVDSKIREFSCDAVTQPNGVKREEVSCPQAYTCSDGACILDPNVKGSIAKIETSSADGNAANIPEPQCTQPLVALGGSEIYDFYGLDNKYGAKYKICLRPEYSGTINTCEITVPNVYEASACDPGACPAGMTAFTGLIKTSGWALGGTYDYAVRFSRICTNNAAGGEIIETTQYTPRDCPTGTVEIGIIPDLITNTDEVFEKISGTVNNKICMKVEAQPTTSQFTIDKTAVYDYAHNKINYTITVRNTGTAISGEPVIIRDVLPSQLVPVTQNILDSFSPRPTATGGLNEVIWELENFGNANDNSYNYTSTNKYSSNGVFIINMVFSIDSNTPNGTIITNTASVTAKGATVSDSADTAYLTTVIINETWPIYQCWWTQHWDGFPAVDNYYLSFDSGCDQNHADTSATSAGSLVGYLYKTQKTGTVPVYQCYRHHTWEVFDLARGRRVHDYVDHFITTDANCEGATFNALLGYMPQTASAETRTVYRCWNKPDSISDHRYDHKVSDQISCGGYDNEQTTFNFFREPVVTEIPPPIPEPYCGDAMINQPWEECDNGVANSNTAPDACRQNCSLPRCGDNVIDFIRGEECEPPNTATCDANCHTIAQPPENVTNYTYVPPTSTTPPTTVPPLPTTPFIALGTCADNPIVSYLLQQLNTACPLPGESIIQLGLVSANTPYMIIAGGTQADVAIAIHNVLMNLTKWSAEGARLDITTNQYLTTVGRLRSSDNTWRYNMEYNLPAGIHFLGVPFTIPSKTITNMPAIVSAAGGIFAYDITNNRSVKFDVNWPTSPAALSDLTTFGNELEAYYVKLNQPANFMIPDATKQTVMTRNVPAGWVAYTPYAKQKLLSQIIPYGVTVNSLWCYENNQFVQKSLAPDPTIDVGQGCWINIASGATLS